MKKKINIAELLKDCPKGMELDCLLFKNAPVYFNGITNNYHYPIEIKVEYPDGTFEIFELSKEGCIYDRIIAKCVIFPKGKTTWEGFVPPCKFKDGDILSNGICICLYNGNESDKYYGFYVGVGHIDYPNYFINRPQNSYFTKENSRFATEEEKQKLFQAIEDNGYRWNAEAKSLEKLNKNKFDIANLKPFDKVLVRQNVYGKWGIDFFGFYTEGYYYTTGSCIYVQCIPYEGNEHLRGKSDDCDDFYKTW